MKRRGQGELRIRTKHNRLHTESRWIDIILTVGHGLDRYIFDKINKNRFCPNFVEQTINICRIHDEILVQNYRVDGDAAFQIYKVFVHLSLDKRRSYCVKNARRKMIKLIGLCWFDYSRMFVATTIGRVHVTGTSSYMSLTAQQNAIFSSRVGLFQWTVNSKMSLWIVWNVSL